MGMHVRTRRAMCACALLIIIGAVRAHADLVTPRVRPVGSRMVELLARGYAASHTLARLVDALERTNVIVHIEERWLLDGGPTGTTQFVAAAGGARYLRISLDPRMHDDVAMALLGHELQHAAEIAKASWVVDDETLARLYARIGYASHPGARSGSVETIQARETARHVLNEVRTFGVRRLSSTD